MRRVYSVWLCGALALQCGVGCTFDSSGTRWFPSETDCANGMDDDGDGLADCDDGDCDADPACSSNSNNTNTNANNNGNNNPGPEYCTNDVDDDGDGLVDCHDPDCSSAPVCVPEDCGNDVDDDGDGLADCDDPECTNSPLCVVESCGNGTDDDGDGQVDCDDDDCLSTPECGVCHPITSVGCAAGMTCYLNYNDNWFGGCLAGSGGGGQWGWCDNATDCQSGYYCSGSYYVCLRVCHPGGNDCASVVGTWCRPFSDFGSTSPWGVCVY